MPVARLDALLDAAWSYRLALVVAPAGSGKTTLLARFAERAPGPVGWYRAEAWDRAEDQLVSHIAAALAAQLGHGAGAWRTIGDVANALAAWRGERVLLIVDDLHSLEGAAAEAALEQLIEYAPPSLTVIAGTRLPPRFNLSRLRVSGALMELGSDDLRFRSWEVERLFRDYYGEPLPPEELARLARRTEGWAAGLQLFHLATRGRAPDERRRVLAGLGPSSRLMRDYLTRNVLEQLPADLRHFLVETSVLGRLNAAICDRLLGRSDSAEQLTDLERRRMFIQPLAEDGNFRYHEVLRSYLQGVLLEERGEASARERFRRAAELLAQNEALPEALEAYCRAEEWQMAQALLGRDGGQAAVTSSAWLDALPATVLAHDPWLQLAGARRLRAEGRFVEAAARYQRAERAFAGSEPAATCREERQALAVWLDPVPPTTRHGWSALLRAAVAREPLAIVREARALPPALGRLLEGLALLLAGEVRAARRLLLSLAEDEQAEPLIGTTAALAAAIADLLAGQPNATAEVEGAVGAAEKLGLEWLARLGRASLALVGAAEHRREAAAVAAACDSSGDEWGAALARLFELWGSVARDPASAEPADVATQLRRVGAPVLEAWARALITLAAAHAGGPDAIDAAFQADSAARSAGVPAARMLSYLALAEAGAPDGGEYLEQAHAIAVQTGLALPALANAASAPSPPAGTNADGNGSPARHVVPPLRVRLLGGYQLEIEGRPVALEGMRPRVRSLLRLLSVEAGSPVHHEAIEFALWPEADRSAASRNLHVAVATLRRALEPSAGRGGFQLIRRVGESYVLAVPVGGVVDLHRFEQSLRAGRVARERRDSAAAIAAFRTTAGLYTGELLPEEGPAEWISQRREVVRQSAVAAAQALAELLLQAGQAEEAARVCSDGLRIERYHDPLWRLLIGAREEAGDHGAATRARASYGEMLAELGLEPHVSGVSAL